MNHPPIPEAESTDIRPPGAVFGLPRGVAVFLGILLLAAAVFLVYYPASGGPFIFDDFRTLVNNPSIRKLQPFFGFGGPLSPPSTSPTHGRPLVNLALALSYHFSGLEPFGYRIAHFVVHVLTAVLLWIILFRTLRLDYFRGKFDRAAGPLSFAATLVWAMHPLHTETLVYVTQRTELMMGFFYLATIYCSMRYWAAESAASRAGFVALATLACLLGMLSKEMMASAPAMVLLYERTFLAGTFRRALQRSWLLYACLALTWLPVIAFNIDGGAAPGAGFGKGATGPEWWYTQSEVQFLYLKLAVWPWPLVINYEYPVARTALEVWPALLATGVLAIATVVFVFRRSVLGFVAVWFFAVLSPTLLVPLVGETVSERRMYVPLAAIVPLLLIGGYELLRRGWRYVTQRTGREPIRGGPVVVLSVTTISILVAFAGVCGHRLKHYQDEFSLRQADALYRPNSPVVQLNFGTMLAERGRVSEAIEHFEAAVRLAPDPKDVPEEYAERMRYQSRFNLAKALENTGRVAEAIEMYRFTLEARPDDAQTHYNLARLLEGEAQWQQAVDHYRRAIAAQPDFAEAHSNLGTLLLARGRIEDGIESIKASMRLQENPADYLNLALAYGATERLAEALPLAEKALEIARSQGETVLAEDIEKAVNYLRRQQVGP